MTGTWDTLIIVWCGVVLAGITLCALGWAAIALDRRLEADRRRRRRRELTAHGHDDLEAWGVSIPVVWPTRGPRNGDPFEGDPR